MNRVRSVLVALALLVVGCDAQSPPPSQPPRPPGTLATSVSDAGVTVQWTRSVTPNVTYNVYRTAERHEAAGAEERRRRVAAGLAATSFLDRDVAAGTTYRYSVTSLSASGRESEPSSEAQAVVPPEPTPEPEPEPTPEPEPEPTPEPEPEPVHLPPFHAFEWTNVTPAPAGLTEAQGIAVDGHLYVFGGYTSWTPFRTTTHAYRYDPRTDHWQRIADLPFPWTHAAVTADGHDIYLAGGHQNTNDRNYDQRHLIPDGERTVLRYDTRDDTWHTDVPPLPEARGSGGFTRLGRHLHFFGGHTPDPLANGTRQDRAEHWALHLDHPEAGWQPRAPLPNPRNHLGATTHDGFLYAIGGQHDHARNAAHQTDVHRYDPALDEWNAVAPLPFPVSHHTSTTLTTADLILVLGGEVEHGVHHDAVLAYDPTLDTWEQRGTLPFERGSAVAGILHGNLVFTGGDFETDTIRGVPLP